MLNKYYEILLYDLIRGQQLALATTFLNMILNSKGSGGTIEKLSRAFNRLTGLRPKNGTQGLPSRRVLVNTQILRGTASNIKPETVWP